MDTGYHRLLLGLQGEIFHIAADTGTGVVVLAGSSGRVDVAKQFASQGATAIALGWFGGEGQV